MLNFLESVCMCPLFQLLIIIIFCLSKGGWEGGGGVGGCLESQFWKPMCTGCLLVWSPESRLDNLERCLSIVSLTSSGLFSIWCSFLEFNANCEICIFCLHVCKTVIIFLSLPVERDVPFYCAVFKHELLTYTETIILYGISQDKVYQRRTLSYFISIKVTIW